MAAPQTLYRARKVEKNSECSILSAYGVRFICSFFYYHVPHSGVVFEFYSSYVLIQNRVKGGTEAIVKFFIKFILTKLFFFQFPSLV